MQQRGSMLHSHGLSNNPYPEPNKSNFSYGHLLRTLGYIQTKYSHPRLGLPRDVYLGDLPVNILKAFLPSSIVAICNWNITHHKYIAVHIPINLSEIYPIKQ